MAKWLELMQVADAIDYLQTHPDYSNYQKILAAVVDDGCDIEHPDLSGRIVSAMDLEKSNEGMKKSGTSHGTRSVGLVAADPNSSTGFAGGVACVDQVGILAVRYKKNTPISTDASMYRNIVKEGAHIISCSYGYGTKLDPGEVTTLRQAIEWGEANGRDGKGTVFLFAIGNEGVAVEDKRIFATKNTLLVGSTVIPPDNFQQSDIKYRQRYAQHQAKYNGGTPAAESFEFHSHSSNFGIGISICAPGGDPSGAQPVSTENQGKGEAGLHVGKNYAHHGDTSGACALVAGVVALMLAANPKLTAEQVKVMLCGTATQVDPLCGGDGVWGPAVQIMGNKALHLDNGLKNQPYSKYYGFGRVNALEAVKAAIAAR